MRYWTYIVLLCVNMAISQPIIDELIVNTAQGPVRGRYQPSVDLWTFLNIPYATAPTGENKFKAPLPPPTWKKPYDGNDKSIICPQAFAGIPLDVHTLQEDCLIANVFVPNTKEKNLPVLVHVHGGGFQIGWGNMVTTYKLMQNKDIIIVNFNYRLGIHGFLCLGTEDAPGNAGMKDQVALLRWVQQNIAEFGGNPSDVTIASYSAGSASVDLLMISKAAEGLFHRVIPESGASLAAFAVQTDPLQNAKNHARKLNYTNVDDIYALEEFYKTLSIDILTSDSFLTETDSTCIFSPCVERDTGDEAFLTASPLNVIKRGDYKKVPMLYGFANMEGLFRMKLFDTWKDKMNEKFSDFLPADLKFKTNAEREKVAQQIKEFYFGDKPVDKDNVLQYINYFSDVLFTHPMLWAIKLYVEAGHDQIYLYEFSFVDEDTPLVPYTNVRGADHCAQTLTRSDGKNLFEPSEDNITKEYRNMKKIIREVWLNFVKTGNPVTQYSSLPAWPAVGSDRSPHMSFGQDVELRGVLLEERTHFWDDIYQKYYKEPMPPS